MARRAIRGPPRRRDVRVAPGPGAQRVIVAVRERAAFGRKLARTSIVFRACHDPWLRSLARIEGKPIAGRRIHAGR